MEKPHDSHGINHGRINRNWSKEGANLIVSGRHQDKGLQLVTELRAHKIEAEFILADVSLEDDVMRLIAETVKRFSRLDIAVNTAGSEFHHWNFYYGRWGTIAIKK